MTRKSYPKYKDSGIDWLGKIPKHWGIVSCKFGYSIQLGKMLQNTPLSSFDVKVPYLKALNVQWETIDIMECSKMWASLDDIKKYSIHNNDLLVCEGGEVGRSGIVTDLSKNYIIQNALHRVRAKEKNNVKYLMYLLEVIGLSDWFNILCNKATIAHFTSEKFNNLKIVLPPSIEQTAIANFLDKETSRIASLIQKKEKQLELLKEKRSALITQAVSKGLNPNVKMKDSGIEWLGKIPKHWEVKRLKFLLSEPLKYGANESAEYDEPSWPRYVRITDINENNLLRDETFKSIPEEIASPYFLEDRDMLFARSGTVGKTFLYQKSWGKVAFAGYLIRARFERTQNLPKFTYYFSKSKIYEVWIKSNLIQSTIQNVSAEKYSNLLIPLPKDIDEQNTISDFLDKETSRIDSLTEKIKKSIELLKEYRSALITSAVTGKIDVRESQTKTKNVILFQKQKTESLKPIETTKPPISAKTASKREVSKSIQKKNPPIAAKATLKNKSFKEKELAPLAGKTSQKEKEFTLVSKTISKKEAVKSIKEKKPELAAKTISKKEAVKSIKEKKPELTAKTISKKEAVKSIKEKKPELAAKTISKKEAVKSIKEKKPELIAKTALKKDASGTIQEKKPPLAAEINLKKETKPIKRKRPALVSGKTSQKEKELTLVSKTISKKEAVKSIKDNQPELIAKTALKKDASGTIQEKKPPIATKATLKNRSVKEKEIPLIAGKASQKKASPLFKKTVLGAEIIAQLKDNPHFGRTKFMKTLYLCEAHLQIPLKGTYKREAAGPLDNSIYKMESIIKKNKWFEVIKTNSMHKYKALKNSKDYKAYFDKYWGVYTDQLNQLLSLVKKFTTEQSEIADTIYAVWNDFLIDGKKPSDSEIIYEVKSNWHESKKRFSAERLKKAIQWMREQNLIPQGYGPKTKTSRGAK